MAAREPGPLWLIAIYAVSSLAMIPWYPGHISHLGLQHRPREHKVRFVRHGVLPVTRQSSAAILFLCALSAVGCSGNESAEEAENWPPAQLTMSVHRLSDAKSTDLDETLRNATLVFVGRLRSADFRSNPASGYYAFTASTRWTKLRTLKGHDDHRTIEVLCVTVGADLPLERTGYGYRLSPSYLLVGQDYVVVTTKLHFSDVGDGLRYFIGGGGLDVWPAVQENISGLEARLADLSRRADDRGPHHGST